MKILYFHQHFSTPQGATGTRSFEMARRLAAANHEVTIVCGSSANAETGLSGPYKRGRREGSCENFRVIELHLPYSNKDRFLRRTLTFLKFAQRSIGIALRESCDLVFATSTPLTAAIPGIFARWIGRKTFIFEVRDAWPELPKAMGVITNPLVLGAMSVLERLAYRSAHGLIGLSPGIVSGITDKIDSKHVVMIPNASDLELFGDAAPIETMPAGINPNNFVAVFTGAHGLANGLEAVLDAAAELKRRGNSSIKFLLVGDGRCKPALEQQAAQEKLDSVVFSDPLPKYELARLLKRVDVGLMILRDVPAFYRGTSPNKFFDYIAASLPVVTNYPGWVAELIVDNKCGIAVPPGSPDKFADALETMAHHKSFCSDSGANSRRLAEKEFSRDALGDRFVEYIEGTATLIRNPKH